MKAITILILASLPVPQVQLSPKSQPQPQPHFARQAQSAPRKGGQWYFARTGHAVYCYGPVMTLPDSSGDIEHVATFCRGERLMVPLKD
jgi:hypothetical protein